jgi:hypothetical protein
MDKGFFSKKISPKSSHYEEKKNSMLSYLENRFQQVDKL